MKSALLSNVVVAHGAIILETFSCENKPLGISWYSLLGQYLLFDASDGVCGFSFESHAFSCKSPDEDLVASAKPEYQMDGAFLLNVVVSHGTLIVELLSCENKPLLVSWDSFLCHYFFLEISNGVSVLCLNGDGLSCKGPNEDLVTSSQSQDEVKSAFLLYVVVAHSALILEALTCENKSLLIGRDAFLGQDLFLDGSDAVSVLCLDGDGLSCEGPNEDLESTTKSKHQVDGVFLLDVVVSKSPFLLELLSCKNEPLLVGRDTFLILDHLLEVSNSLACLNLASHGPSGECLYKDLHVVNDYEGKRSSRTFKYPSSDYY